MPTTFLVRNSANQSQIKSKLNAGVEVFNLVYLRRRNKFIWSPKVKQATHIYLKKKEWAMNRMLLKFYRP